jgi:23S rRNA (adenine2503-C2)-methyltransferase
MSTRYDLTQAELAELLTDQPAYRVRQVWAGLYRQLREPAEMTDLPLILRERLASELPASLEVARASVGDHGRTVKYLWRLGDGAAIETVRMSYDDRCTVCVSTQAGCAMACGFCATGQAGFERHLRAGEIIEQVIRAARDARPERVSHVVFMGMGEPLANYDATWEAVTRLHDDVGISARRLTISTVGVVPGICRLAEESLPVNLAVSLHAADDELRDQLVPLNRRYPLHELVEACHDYRRRTRRRITFEWALIDAVNDTKAQARALADIAGPLGAHVNLIPLNPTSESTLGASPASQVRQFARWLRDHGVNATIRRNRGTDIDAACGQLRASTQRVGVDPPVRLTD